MERSEDFKTGLVRVAFSRDLFTPKEKANSAKKQYGCTLLIPKGPGVLAPYEKAIIEAGRKEHGEKFEQKFKDGLIKSPLLDGDGKQGMNKKTGERHPGYAGHWFIRPTSGEGFPPKVVDKRVMPIVNADFPDGLYSGCYVFAVINAYTWYNQENGHGISFGISMVQKAKDGEKLGGGGGADVEKWAEVIEDEGEAPAETKSGSGAGGLFS